MNFSEVFGGPGYFTCSSQMISFCWGAGVHCKFWVIRVFSVLGDVNC